MSLVIAGNYGVSFDEAEKIKKDKSREKEVFQIVRPVVEKMAAIVKRFLKDYDVDEVYVVGGACTFSEFEAVFQKELKKKVIKTYKPYGISFDEAEKIKKDKSREKEVFQIVRPVVEKMAAIVKRFLKDYDVDEVYVVGGACTFSEFEAVFQKELKKKVIKTYKPLLVTPLGIALTGIMGE